MHRCGTAELDAAVRALGRADALGLIRPPGASLEPELAGEPEQATAADPSSVASALSAALLVAWEEVHGRHPNVAGQTPAAKAARRNEQALQLAPAEAGVGAQKRSCCCHCC